MHTNTPSQYNIAILAGPSEPAAAATRILQQAGCIVHHEQPDNAWLQRIQQIAPDVILLVTTPDETETADKPAVVPLLDYCRQLRADRTCQAIPILLLSPAHAHDDHRQALREDLADVIPWPCAPEELVARVIPHGELYQCRNQFAQQISAYRQAQTVLDRRTRELILIKEATQAFNSTLDFAAVLQTVLREMHQLLNIVSTSFWLQDPQTGQLECLRATGPNSERLKGWRLEPGQGLTGQVAQNGKALIVHDTRLDKRHFKGVDEYTGIEIRSLMSLPLYAKDEQIGVLNLVDTAANSFSEDDLRLLEPIAAAAANAIKNARLFAELQEAKEHAEQARQEAEAANHAKSLFLANMSHELRTPLNAILGFTYLLSQDIADKTVGRDALAPVRRKRLSDDADGRDYVALIKRSGEHLLRLINQVLDLSKIEAQKMSVTETDIDLQRFLEDILDLFRLSAQEKHLSLKFECAPDVPGYIRSDDIKLRQILLNLLSNAVKFTTRGQVALRVFTSATTAASDEIKAVCSSPERIAAIRQHPNTHLLFFEVADTGPGIAPDEVDALFDAFVQAAVGTRSHEGTGLGLAISRKFVHLLGGEIAVNSTPGAGSSFWFYLPIVAVDASAPRAPVLPQKVSGLAPDQPRYKMLVVDDRPEERTLLTKLLEPIGFEVQEAARGQDAVERSAAWKPDLIWLDIRMPGMDGYDVLQRLEGLTPRPIIIAVTASTFLEGEENLITHTCDGFLRKPFQVREIFDLIRQHLGVRFVYEPAPEPESFHTPETVSAQDIAALPESLRSQLRQAVEMIDLNGTAALIESFQTGYPMLAQQLKHLLKQYRFDILQNLFILPPGDGSTPSFCQKTGQSASEP